jgi:predicted transcriptional regulator
MTERLLVRDLMTVGVTTCPPQTPVVEVARLLLERELEAVVVLNSDGHGIGVISQDDVVDAYGRDDRDRLTAEDIMRDDVPQIPPDIPLRAAAQIMRDQGVRALFLSHRAEGITYPAGVITYRHFLRQLAARDENDLADLGIRAVRKEPLQSFFERRDAARRQARQRDQE